MTLVYILYDSINNSIFAGQIWSILVKKIIHRPSLKVILITFEPKIIQHHYSHDNIKIIQIKRGKYWGKISLFLDFLKLKKQIKKLSLQSCKIIARGPFAGWIALKLCRRLKNQSLIIQARGLAGQEYAYTHKNGFFVAKLLFKLRYLQLNNLEKNVYGFPLTKGIIIECVSKALQDYLINTYHTNKNILKIARQDLPPLISAKQLITWRRALRSQFNIDSHRTVYCYSGSNHPWQCPEQTIAFFNSMLKENNQAFLLILTPQVIFFKKLIQAHHIPSDSYLVLSVPHSEVYKHLAIADHGLLFREPHILNWVCRPTKAVEYQSAGLNIIHNNTIEWLTKNNQ